MLAVFSACSGAYGSHQLPSRSAVRPASSRVAVPTMQTSIGCEMRPQPKSSVAIDFDVPTDIANGVHSTVMSALGKKSKVPGFRKGVVPPDVLLNHVGTHKVKKATVEEIIDLAMKQAGGQLQVSTCGEATLEGSLDDVAEKYTLGEGLKFTINVDVYPEVQIKEDDYKGLKCKAQRVPFNQEAYDEALFKLRDQHANVYDAPDGTVASQGDQVFANMNGFMANPDGTKGDPLPAVAGGEGVSIPLVDGRFMFGLAEGLVGVKAGDVREVSVTFPSRTSVPQLAGRAAVFEVECLKVQTRELPECDDVFAARVMPDMTWEALDAKLREGVQEEVDSQQKKVVHRMLERALVGVLPETMELPETLVEEVTKERFAMMLADMRQRGTTDEQLKDLISPENFEKYKMVSRPSVERSIKGDLALKEVARQQELSVSEEQVEDEMMTLQAQAVQRGEKFKPSEARPKIEAQLEKNLLLGWLETYAEVELVDEEVETVDDILGASPEQLAANVKAAEAAKSGGAPAPAPAPAPAAAPAPAPVAEAKPEPKPETAAAPEPATTEEAGGPKGSAPDGFEWGATF